MGYKTRFYLDCFKYAWRGSIDGANAAASIPGALILYLLYSWTGNSVMLPDTLFEGIRLAVACLGAAWVVIFLLRLLSAPGHFFAAQQIRIDELENETQPKLSLEYEPYRDPCIVNVGSGDTTAWYYRVRPRVLGQGRIVGCRGQMVGITRREGEDWLRAPYSDPRFLRWVNKGFDAIDLDPGVPQMLDVIYIDAKNELHLCDELEQSMGATIWKDTPHRFKVIVTAENAASCTLTIEVRNTGSWPALAVSEVSSQ